MKRLVHPLFILCCHAIAFGENSDLEDNEMVNRSYSSEVSSEPLSCTPYDLSCASYEQSNPLVCNSCRTWEVEIDALYWRTSSTQKIYALREVQGGVNEIDEYSQVKPHNDWGVRAKVGYFFPCSPFFTEAEYTFFRQTLSDSTTTPTQVSYFTQVINSMSFIKASVSDEYQRAGGRLGYRFYDSCCGNFYGFSGIDWLYLKEEERMNGATLTTNLPEKFKQEKSFSSAAFFVGSGGKFYFLKHFGLAGEADIVAAIGRRKNSFFSNVELPTLTVTNKIHDATIIVPGFDCNLELFYEWPCKSISYLFAIGYEQHYFFNALLGNRLYFGPNVTLFPSQFTELHNIGFGGLYLSAKALF